MKTGYVIATVSRKNDDMLFMVDRSVQKKSFWSHSIEEAYVYDNPALAKAKADSYRYNHPRVLTYEQAYRISEEQREQRESASYSTLHLDEDMSWDAHKIR